MYSVKNTLALCVILLFNTMMFGQINTYVGSNPSDPGNFNLSDNWSENKVPSGSETALIPSGFDVTITAVLDEPDLTIYVDDSNLTVNADLNIETLQAADGEVMIFSGDVDILYVDLDCVEFANMTTLTTKNLNAVCEGSSSLFTNEGEIISIPNNTERFLDFFGYEIVNDALISIGSSTSTQQQMHFSNCTITNYGSIVKFGHSESVVLNIISNSILNNEGTIEIQSDRFLDQFNAAFSTINNNGNIIVGDSYDGYGNALNFGFSDVTNNGVIDIINADNLGLNVTNGDFENNGVLAVDARFDHCIYSGAAFPVEIDLGGDVSLAGEVNQAVTIDWNNTELKIGPNSDRDILHFENPDIQLIGVDVTFDISGTQGPDLGHDQIQFDGDLDFSFGTSMKIELVNGFVPSDGDEWVLITAGNIPQGRRFNEVVLPALPTDMFWKIDYTATEVIARVKTANVFTGLDSSMPYDFHSKENWSFIEVPTNDQIAYIPNGFQVDVDNQVDEPELTLIVEESSIFVNEDFSIYNLIGEGGDLEIISGDSEIPYVDLNCTEIVNFGTLTSTNIRAEASGCSAGIENDGIIVSTPDNPGQFMDIFGYEFINEGTISIGKSISQDFQSIVFDNSDITNTSGAEIIKVGDAQSVTLNIINSNITNDGTIAIEVDNPVNSSTQMVVRFSGMTNNGGISVEGNYNQGIAVDFSDVINNGLIFVLEEPSLGMNVSEATLVNNGSLVLEMTDVNPTSALFSSTAFPADLDFAGEVLMNGPISSSTEINWIGAELEIGAGVSDINFQNTDVSLDDIEITFDIIGTGGPGTGNDVIELAGDVTFGSAATAVVDLGNGFVPEEGDAFILVDAATGMTGEFASVDLPTLPVGLEWELSYAGDEFTITVVEAGCNVPPIFDQAFNLTGVLSQISWFEVPGADRYRIQFRPLGEVDWDLNTSTNLITNLTGLTPSTVYEVRFASRCNGWGPYGEISQFTTSDCVYPETESTESLNGMIERITLVGLEDVDRYQVRFRRVGQNGWSTTNITNGAVSKNLINLIPATDYEFQKRSRCSVSNRWTEYSENEFFTSSSCDSPDPVSVSFPEPDRALVEYTEQENAENYQVRYREQGNPNWIVRSSTTTTRLLTNLLTDQNYIYQMRAKCPVWTDWSEDFTFTTPASGQSEGVISSRSSSSQALKVYPNPARNMVFVSIDGIDLNEASLSLIDINGKPVMQKTGDLNSGVSVSDIPSGQYILRVQTQKQLFSERLLIIN